MSYGINVVLAFTARLGFLLAFSGVLWVHAGVGATSELARLDFFHLCLPILIPASFLATLALNFSAGDEMEWKFMLLLQIAFYGLYTLTLFGA